MTGQNSIDTEHTPEPIVIEPVKALIAKHTPPNGYYITAGKNQGVETGMQFRYPGDLEIIHPHTDEVLETITESLATFTVIEVFEKVCLAKLDYESDTEKRAKLHDLNIKVGNAVTLILQPPKKSYERKVDEQNRKYAIETKAKGTPLQPKTQKLPNPPPKPAKRTLLDKFGLS